MIRKLLISLAFACLASSVEAIPARRGIWRTITLTDGSQVRAELCGDEHLSFWRTADNLKFIHEENSPLFRKTDSDELTRISQPRRQQAEVIRKARRSGRIGGDHIEYTGKKKGIIILTEFSDKSFALGHNKAFYEEIANATELSKARMKLGFTGSVKQFFLDQSRGQFELEFDVVGPVKLKNPYAYYGAHSGSNNDARPGKMVAEACELVKGQVNFADYDWDGNGYVDQVFVLYAGKGEASGGGEDTIWPHEWQLRYSDYGSSLDVGNNMAVNTYACGNEIFWDEIGRDRVDGIGTICHEFSHCLGLPDMYDTGGDNYGMGTWDVMDQGSYNGGSFIPSAYTSFERAYAGWLAPIELKEPTTVQHMRPISEDGQSFVIYNDAYPDEYYLLENRQQTGWDAGQYGYGLLILHVDYNKGVWEQNSVNDTSSGGYYDSDGKYQKNDHQRCTIFHADGEEGYIYVESLAGDPFPYINEAAGIRVDALTDETAVAAILYNANAKGEFLMNKPITNIVQHEDGTISFDFMGGSNTNIITGIKAVANGNSPSSHLDSRVFDLRGRNLGTSPDALPKGIYIIGGKKVVK